MERILLGVIVVSGTVPLTAAECHCNTIDACTVFPSAPCSQVGNPDSCQVGWFGAYCQKQNIALGMPAEQSSTYTESSEKTNWTSYDFPASLGVDGSTTTEFYDEPFTCTHTRQSSDQHYWRLSLNTTDKIEHLKLYLRNYPYNQNRHNGMEILVGSQMCYNWSSTEHPPLIANVTCNQPLTGNTVTIRVPGGFDTYLTLCEVQIFVCSDGWFGTNCDKQCRCLKNTEVCDKNTGQCLGGCASGYTGIGCQTICSDGWFGTNCDKQCRCLKNTEVCDKNTGQCLGGCASGYTGIGCQTICSDGWFGTNCDKQCRCLKNTEVCDKNTGQCLGGCASGYTGIGCQTICSDGWFGTDCDKRCRCLKNTEVCDKNTGQCLGGCASGYTGIGCQTICSDGWFGTDCDKQCGCLNNTEVCDKITGQCLGGCAPRNSGMDREITVAEEVSNWGLPVAIILGTLLIFTVIAATIYIKRLMKQLEDLKTMMSEEHYVGLDERTTAYATCNTYEQGGNASPYYITVN